MNKKFNWTLTAYILVLCLLLATLVFNVLLVSGIIAFADTYEISSDSILNFNQLVQNNEARPNFAGITASYLGNGMINFNGTFNNSYDAYYRIYNNYTFNVLNNHVYYIHTYSNYNTHDTYTFAISRSLPESALRTWTDSSYLFTATSDFVGFISVKLISQNEYNDNFSFYVIDLTQMYGDNVPTLTECNEIFINNYYPYTISSLIIKDNLDYFNQGIFSLLNHSSFNLVSRSDFANSVSNFTYNDTSSNTLYAGYKHISAGDDGVYLMVDPYVDYTPYTNHYAAFRLPLITTLLANTTIRINAVAGADFGSGSPTLNYFSIYGFNNNEFIKIADSPLIGTQQTNPVAVSFDFVIPYNMDFIYIVLNRPSFDYYFTDFVVYGYDIDFYGIYNDQYDIGYNNGIADSEQSVLETQRYYEDIVDQLNEQLASYNVGNDNYNNIFNAGKTAGINEQNIYTFSNLMTSVVEAPIGAILQMFNFEFLGYNFKSFVLLLFTACIIITIVRLVMGG